MFTAKYQCYVRYAHCSAENISLAIQEYSFIATHKDIFLHVHCKSIALILLLVDDYAINVALSLMVYIEMEIK